MWYHGKSYSHIVAITEKGGFQSHGVTTKNHPNHRPFRCWNPWFWGYPWGNLHYVPWFSVLFPTIFPEVGTKDCFQQGVRRRPWCCSGRMCHQRGTWIRQNPHFFLDVHKIKRHLSPHFNTASGLNMFETHWDFHIFWAFFVRFHWPWPDPPVGDPGPVAPAVRRWARPRLRGTVEIGQRLGSHVDIDVKYWMMLVMLVS